MEQQILTWITQYGYAAIFLLLVLGIVGLPVPDETLLTFSGYLIFRGHLSLPLAFATAFTGSIIAMTISYTLGRTFGIALIHRYGKYIRVTEEHVNRAHSWFERVGHWGLTFGYFVPGVRHLTAYAAGMSDVEPRHFALYAYPGGFLWVSTFVGLGYFLGERWKTVQKELDSLAIAATAGAAVLVIAYVLWRKFRQGPRK
jgi:membrane protein DedA with SNARE-associated domain